MFPKLNKASAKYIASTTIIVALAGVFLARTADAKLAANTVNPIAMISENGRHLVVTGPISCTGTERTELRVIVTQRSSGALAEGRAFITCSDTIQQWQIRAQTRGGAEFQEGPGTVVAVARSFSDAQPTDAHQWLVNVTIVKE